MKLLSILALSFLVLGAGACDNVPPTEPSVREPIRLLLPQSFALGVGDSAQLKAVLLDENGGQAVLTTTATWHSANIAIATVDTGGIVTAVAVGTTTVTVTAGGETATVPVQVTASSGDATKFSGVTAGSLNRSGVLNLSVSPALVVTGTIQIGPVLATLAGVVDAPTGIVNAVGGGFTFIGVRAGTVITGAFTDPNGHTGGFAVTVSTHRAVTPYCGTFTSDGSTSLGNEDTGAFALAISQDGAVVGATLPRDASNTAIKMTGQRNGSAILLTAPGQTISGTIENTTATGQFRTAAGSDATFTVTPANCP